MKQNVMSLVGTGRTMKEAADKADELMNEFIEVDEDFLLVTLATQSLYADEMFYHIITIAYNSHLYEDGHELP